jgi:hypothetical protein
VWSEFALHYALRSLIAIRVGSGGTNAYLLANGVDTPHGVSGVAGLATDR